MRTSLFHPLMLGVVDRSLRERAIDLLRYEAWHEGVRPQVKYIPHPEEQVFRWFREAADDDHGLLWVVLGEAGAGKSRLMNEWFRRWMADVGSLQLGTVLPVLVRLRNLKRADIIADRQALADRLWELGLRERALLGTGEARNAYRLERQRLFRPAWLLDGLDEIPNLLGPDLFAQLADLPGAKLVTCRSAVFRSYSTIATPYKEREFEILPLRRPQWQDFLRCRLGNPVLADKLACAIADNAQLSELAGNPLMLDLIAEVHGDRAELTLPSSRAEFYRRAVARRWALHLSGEEEQELRPWRDHVLTNLAAQMQLTKIETDSCELDAASEEIPPSLVTKMEMALQRSGLLIVDHGLGLVRFPHLTLQEYYLAQWLAHRGCPAAVMDYWSDPRYEETLALLLSRQSISPEADSDAIPALHQLIDWGRITHGNDPAILWRDKFRRSPLRVSLHLVRRSGISLGGESLLLLGGASFLFRVSLASDAMAPLDALTALSSDPDQQVRKLIAKNPGAPPWVLASLARDPDRDVRFNVAANAATPTDGLIALACDPDGLIRQYIASNTATPHDVLLKLAHDPDGFVKHAARTTISVAPETLAAFARDSDGSLRELAASNVATPPEVLAVLACDADPEVRLLTARNIRTPPEILVILSRDPYEFVRRVAVSNTSMPPEILAALARERDEGAALNRSMPSWTLTEFACSSASWMRRLAASNIATPSEVLTALAHDSDTDVRMNVVENSSSPLSVHLVFARDRSAGVRKALAKLAATPSEALRILARDSDEFVRGEVARHRATPPEALSLLASDSSDWIRSSVAAHTSTPIEVLTILSCDSSEYVRAAVAGNAATSSVVQRKLAHDAHESVRIALAGNPRASYEVLTKLAHDPEVHVRRRTAGNTGTPLAVLAGLLHDPDDGAPERDAPVYAQITRGPIVWVRGYAATNPTALLEDIIGALP
jgi:hypothetical protein